MFLGFVGVRSGVKRVKWRMLSRSGAYPPTKPPKRAYPLLILSLKTKDLAGSYRQVFGK